ncbi:hypothetical protein AVEN_222508-1 [Araneus ventricosus]|uniref:Uncharacterized protein n=1 Tax=Araneus ventricosus TaxID=182803 RepID=A0A4Y2LMW9_ARAVE|nr:hypothetical protein AVEN_222508-1 [Araneus ventricosus]
MLDAIADERVEKEKLERQNEERAFELEKQNKELEKQRIELECLRVKQGLAESVVESFNQNFPKLMPRPQCPQIRAPKSEVNRIGREADRSLLDPYTKIGKINGYSMPILRDTGATVDVVCQKYVNRDRMTGEHVWVKHIFDDHMTCLPVAQIDVECDLGRVTTKAVVEDKLDQGRYILGNQTADLLKQITESSKLNSEIVNAVVTRSKGRKLGNDESLLEEQVNTEIYDEEILGDGENQAECMVNDEVLPKTDLSDPLKKLIEVDSSNFIGEQQKSKELALLFELVKTKGNQTNFDVKNGVLVRKK